MEIGRLEFYATKRDRRGGFFGKIYPYNPSIRNSLDDGLVFFHESCIPRTSALRTDWRLQGYRYAERFRGRTVYANPVYVAFDMPQDWTTRKGDAAAAVMLLKEADSGKLPDYSSISDAGVRVALISAFPSVYTLSRIGLDIVQSDSQVDQLKACWDGSNDDERAAFLRSLDPATLERALSYLTETEKKGGPRLASSNRLRQILAAMPVASLIPSIAARLTPDMWADELLAIMEDPSKRDDLLTSVKPPFCVYAIAKFIEKGGSLEDDVADMFLGAINKYNYHKDLQNIISKHLRTARGKQLVHDRDYSDLFTECLRTVLRRQPKLALRKGAAKMLTPEHWVDELLGLMGSPADMCAFLASTEPEFCAYAVAKYAEAGGSLDENAAHALASAVRKCTDSDLCTDSMRSVLAKLPHLALVGDITATLTPGMWVDELLGLMSDQTGRKSLLTHAQSAFRVYATARHVEMGGRLDEGDVSGFVSAVRDCEDEKLVAKCLTTVLVKQPRIALISDVTPMLAPEMWVDELLGIMETTQGQFKILAPSQPDFRAHAVQKLIEADINLDIGILKLCPLRSCPILLDQVQWSNDDESYADAVGRWLQEARLCDGGGRKLVVKAAERMHATGNLLSPTMWAHLPAVMKIRLCVFWSNHYADLDNYVVRGGVKSMCIDAYRNSWRGYDQTLKAALILLALPFSTNPKKAFLDANDALICEIVRQFNECDAGALSSFMLGDELQALLQRCASCRYVDDQSVRGFCDGRWWENASAVWCHAGMNRPDGGRRKCDCLCFPENAVGIKDAELPDPKNQFMAALLTNASDAMGGGVNVGPWLDSRDSMSLVDYAYRVSGYVNKMAAALSHMVCRGCGARLRLNYEYPRKSLYGETSHRGLNLPALSATVCSCPNAGDGLAHDTDVYIHYCLNCHRIIDSRECRIRDGEGYYLCMYCGASKVYGPATVCPSCGNTNPKTLGYYTGSLRDELSYLTVRPRSGEVLVVCKARGCKYDAREFSSEFE